VYNVFVTTIRQLSSPLLCLCGFTFSYSNVEKRETCNTKSSKMQQNRIQCLCASSKEKITQRIRKKIGGPSLGYLIEKFEQRKSTV
jgi:hypothetical protein